MNTSTDFQPRVAWRMAALLTGLALINFVDKVSLGMVAVPLMADLNLTPGQFGVLAGSIFWLFSISSIVVSLLANRFSTRWILLVMAFSWALLQLPLMVVSAPAAILACRMLLGAAEGPTAPLSMHEIFKWFPDEKRGLPVAIFNQGAIVGLIAAGLIIPVVSRHWDWRTNFALLAAIGFVWCALWLIFGERQRNSRAAAPQPVATVATATRIPYRRLLTTPSILIVFFLGFAAYWESGLMLTWLPAYLEKGFGFGRILSGQIFALIILFTTPYTILLSLYSQRLQTRGASTRRSRVQIINAAFILGGALLLAQRFIDLPPAIKLLVFALGNGLPTICFALAPPIIAELVPEIQRSAVLAIYTALVTSAGAIAPALAGWLLQTRGGSVSGFETAFVIGAVLLIGAAAISLRYLHPERARERLTRPAVSQPA